MSKGFRKPWCKARSGLPVRFNRKGSGEGFGDCLGGFGAKRGQVQQGSAEGSGKSNVVASGDTTGGLFSREA